MSGEITGILLEHKGFRFGHEELLVRNEAMWRRISVRICSASELSRGRVKMEPECLPVGTIPFIQAALRQLSIDMPDDDSYPDVLHPYLHRRIWRSTLRRVLAGEEGGKPVFVKPATRIKRFTGCVVDSNAEYFLRGISGALPVWCSEVVTWVSEWRYYIVNGKIRAMAPYHGSPESAPNPNVVEEAVCSLEKANALDGYAIDFGVLSTGETALVERNDGFSIGAYAEVPPAVYFEMLSARWKQIVSYRRN